MSPLEDGTPADPAVQKNWSLAVAKVQQGKVDAALNIVKR